MRPTDLPATANLKATLRTRPQWINYRANGIPFHVHVSLDPTSVPYPNPAVKMPRKPWPRPNDYVIVYDLQSRSFISFYGTDVVETSNTFIPALPV